MNNLKKMVKFIQMSIQNQMVQSEQQRLKVSSGVILMPIALTHLQLAINCEQNSNPPWRVFYWR